MDIRQLTPFERMVVDYVVCNGASNPYTDEYEGYTPSGRFALRYGVTFRHVSVFNVDKYPLSLVYQDGKVLNVGDSLACESDIAENPGV